MPVFLLGLGLFVAVHLSRVAAPGWRASAMERWGEGAWKGVYSVLSLVGLVLLGRGYEAAYGETAILYDVPSWGRYVPWALMAAAFVLALASGGPAGRIRRAVGDPLLLATILWAFAHLFVRSDALHVALFGGFLLWASIDLWDARRRRRLGTTAPIALAEGARPWIADGVAVVGGLGLWLAFMAFLHHWLFGVSPLG